MKLPNHQSHVPKLNYVKSEGKRLFKSGISVGVHKVELPYQLLYVTVYVLKTHTFLKLTHQIPV